MLSITTRAGAAVDISGRTASLVAFWDCPPGSGPGTVNPDGTTNCGPPLGWDQGFNPYTGALGSGIDLGSIGLSFDDDPGPPFLKHRPTDCTQPPFTPPALPDGNTVNANIQQGQYMGNGTPLPAVDVWLFQQFQTNGPQDYKQSGQQYMDAGNFNFGAVCTSAGHGVGYCQSAAGLGLIGRTLIVNIQRAATGKLPVSTGGAGTPFQDRPYGDQPRDSQQIANGASYAAWYQRCEGVNGN
jgi:hypothetical protein